MSELAAEVAAVIEAFAAEQRAQAVHTARMQKIVFTRAVPNASLQLEMVLDEQTSPQEVFLMLAKVEHAGDRLLAKAEIADNYSRLGQTLGQIELAQKTLAQDTVRFEADNAVHNIGRRVAVSLTEPQRGALDVHRQSLRKLWQDVDTLQQAIAEKRRVLDGDDPFMVEAERVALRLDQLRGSRQAA